MKYYVVFEYHNVSVEYTFILRILEIRLMLAILVVVTLFCELLTQH